MFWQALTLIGVVSWCGWGDPSFLLGTLFGFVISTFFMTVSLVMLITKRPQVFKIVSEVDRTKLDGTEAPAELMRVLKRCFQSSL